MLWNPLLDFCFLLCLLDSEQFKAVGGGFDDFRYLRHK